MENLGSSHRWIFTGMLILLPASPSSVELKRYKETGRDQRTDSAVPCGAGSLPELFSPGCFFQTKTEEGAGGNGRQSWLLEVWPHELLPVMVTVTRQTAAQASVLPSEFSQGTQALIHESALSCFSRRCVCSEQPILPGPSLVALLPHRLCSTHRNQQHTSGMQGDGTPR